MSSQKTTEIEAMESVQRRVTKLIPGYRDFTYEQRLGMLNLPTLQQRRNRGDMINTFKIRKGIYDAKVMKGFFQEAEISG